MLSIKGGEESGRKDVNSKTEERPVEEEGDRAILISRKRKEEKRQKKGLR